MCTSLKMSDYPVKFQVGMVKHFPDTIQITVKDSRKDTENPIYIIELYVGLISQLVPGQYIDRSGMRFEDYIRYVQTGNPPEGWDE